MKLKFADALSSKTAVDDDPVNLILDEDLKVGDVVVAKAGCKAVGTVTNAKKAGMMGKAGELNLRLEHLTVDDQRVRLRGSKGQGGRGQSWHRRSPDCTLRAYWFDQTRQERRSEGWHSLDCLR